jgi:hypothetical protein
MLPKNVREPSMKVLRFAALPASLIMMAAGLGPAPVQAQSEGPHINMLADTPSKSPEEIEQERARDKAYKDTLKSIPDAKVSNDPWGVVRSNDGAKTATAKTAPAKSAKAKPKTGGNTPN